MKTIEDLREHLFATLAALRDKEHPLEIDRARAIADVAQTLINSAKVEVEHLRAVGSGRSTFIPIEDNDALPPGIKGVIRHRIT